MNILMLNYEFPPIGGGASPVSYELGKRLVDLGHKVTVITMAYKNLPSYDYMDGMEIYRVKCWRTKAMVCHPWEQATYILSTILFICMRMRVSDFDICYAHFIIPTGSIAWWLKKRYKLPYIITSHGSDVIGHNNKRFKFLYSLVKKPWCAIVREASCIVSPSQYLIELMQKTEPSGRYKVIQNGISTDIFNVAGDKKKKILIMCRLQETKNVQTIIKALSKVDLREWYVDILGEGPYRERLQQLVEEKGLTKKVTFKGWVTNKSTEHLKHLHEASIYLSASKIENCPTSILEALACGANVILSDIPAHRQLVEKIDDTVFFPVDNVDILAEKIQKEIDRIEAGNVYCNSYDMSQFDWKLSMKKYDALMNQYKRMKDVVSDGSKVL